MNEEYARALKLGEKSHKEALAAGADPYVPVLDEIVPKGGIASEADLGLKDIPLHAIVGTCTAGRRTAFSPNFMPLLPEKTEFEVKWSDLAEAHTTEGIRDPVRLSEYLNEYYVLEGNKRVSVLKHFGAAAIPAEVKRLIPVKTEEPRIRAYYEYLEFYRHCPVAFPAFTKPGSVAEFLKFAEKDPETDWTADEVRALKSFFMRFSLAFQAVATEDVKGVNLSDAFLVYVKIYGYAESVEKTADELKADLLSIHDEIRLLRPDEAKVAFVLEEAEAKKKGPIGRLLQQEKKLKVAFLYDRATEDSDWTYSHELGRKHLDSIAEGRYTTVKYENVRPEQADAVIDEAVQDGADVIFATTRLFLAPCLRAAVRHPKTKVLICTLNAAHHLIRSYYARIYEAKYLGGVLAGMLAENGKIGYLSSVPTPMNLANINAFALGVKAVRPDAKVYLQWTAEKDADATRFYRENDIRIVSGKELITPSSVSREFGLFETAPDGELVNLAMPVIDWGILYEKLLASIRDGNFDELDKKNSPRALNYWWGSDAGVIDLVLSRHLPPESVKVLEFLREGIKSGAFQIFRGPLFSQEGSVTEDPMHVLTPEEILSMNWLSDNVIGRIPAVDELDPEGQILVAVEEQDRAPETDGGAVK